MQVILTPLSFDYLAAVYQMPSPSRVLAGSDDSPPADAMAMENVFEETERKRPRALVVDDAPDVTEMIAMFLGHAGFDAVMAQCCQESQRLPTALRNTRLQALAARSPTA